MNLKHLALWVLILGTSTVSQAYDLLYHHMTSQSENSLTVANKSYESEEFWILFYDGAFIEEHHFEIPPRSLRTIDVTDLKHVDWDWAVLTKTSDLVLPSTWQTLKGTSFQIKRSDLNNVLDVLNLFLENQKFQITYLDSFNNVLKTETLETGAYLKSVSLKLQWPKNSSSAQVSSSASIMLQSKMKISVLTDVIRKASENKAYFLVSSGNTSSFVAPVEDPKLIAKAREEIRNPQGFMIFADITLNTDEPNRDLSNATKTYWSWKIKKVTGLAQIGADWCHAYPEYIERMLHFWIKQERACFRGQRILRELSAEEVQQGSFLGL